jgi:hypothetical protein
MARTQDEIERMLNALPPETRQALLNLEREMAHLENLLTVRTSVEELEAVESAGDVPLGKLNHLWRRLKERMQQGDEIWHWTTSDETWENHCGRSGIALVRNKKAVCGIITRMN